MTNPNCRVLIFSILRFISTKYCKTQMNQIILVNWKNCGEKKMTQLRMSRKGQVLRSLFPVLLTIFCRI